MCHNHARVGQQTAPVARMMTAFMHIKPHGEIEYPARSHKNGRLFRMKAWPVGGDEHIGIEQMLVGRAEFIQPG